MADHAAARAADRAGSDLHRSVEAGTVPTFNPSGDWHERAPGRYYGRPVKLGGDAGRYFDRHAAGARWGARAGRAGLGQGPT
ncbi:MAG: hypothetical protein QOH72_979 [Solirubrobacteraceae bacterium]|jgi:hypothetical protein|nr:hypothetical protein [Solirubrobacteraceae bacterium]